MSIVFNAQTRDEFLIVLSKYADSNIPLPLKLIFQTLIAQSKPPDTNLDLHNANDVTAFVWTVSF